MLRGHVHIVKLLLKDLRVEVSRAAGACPSSLLHVAPNSAVVSVLLADARFDPNAVDCRGDTPLHVAMQSDAHVSIVRLLLRDARINVNQFNAVC